MDKEEPIKKFRWRLRVQRRFGEGPLDHVVDVVDYSAAHNMPVTCDHVLGSPAVKNWIGDGLLESIMPAESGPRIMTGVEGENESRRGGSVTGAHNCEGCNGCQHADEHAGGWCHAFEHAPENLPCAQHDCFEPARQHVSALVRKYPSMVRAMVEEATATESP